MGGRRDISLANLAIVDSPGFRRYQFNDSRRSADERNRCSSAHALTRTLSLRSGQLKKRLPQIAHFDVRLPSMSFDAEVAPQSATAVPSKCDYLRVYYSDFLSQRPTDNVRRPLFANENESKIESDELLSWLLHVQPRARTETYPLYLLTKEVLTRVTKGRCEIFNSKIQCLEDLLATARSALEEEKKESERIRTVLLQEIGGLNETVDHERAAHARIEQEKTCTPARQDNITEQMQLAHAETEAYQKV